MYVFDEKEHYVLCKCDKSNYEAMTPHWSENKTFSATQKQERHKNLQRESNSVVLLQ